MKIKKSYNPQKLCFSEHTICGGYLLNDISVDRRTVNPSKVFRLLFQRNNTCFCLEFSVVLFLISCIRNIFIHFCLIRSFYQFLIFFNFWLFFWLDNLTVLQDLIELEYLRVAIEIIVKKSLFCRDSI